MTPKTAERVRLWIFFAMGLAIAVLSLFTSEDWIADWGGIAGAALAGLVGMRLIKAYTKEVDRG